MKDLTLTLTFLQWSDKSLEDNLLFLPHVFLFIHFASFFFPSFLFREPMLLTCIPCLMFSYALCYTWKL